MLSDTDVAVLTPFYLQVSGHRPILRYNRNTICKCYFEREERFYLNVPKELYEFIPYYKGVVFTTVELNDEGNVQLVARKLNMTNQEACHFIRNQMSDNLIIHMDSINKSLFAEPRSFDITKYHNAKFLLLEDLAAPFRKPCILDLKMGTRTHGYFQDVAKKQLKIDRASNSTSLTLGVRFGGMRLYRPGSGYTMKNKHFGRQLDAAGFARSLADFLHDGSRLRADLIEPIVHRLRSLRRAVDALADAWRLYGVSLLVMYEGDSDESASACLSSSTASFDVRMVDFAMTSGADETRSHPTMEPDGLLLGIDSTIAVLEQLLLSDVSARRKLV